MTVSKFIAQWMRVEKLDVRPSLVGLRLVRCGPGKPEAAEEAAALRPAALLDDPRLTLRAAGVVHGSSLLADVPASQAGTHVRACLSVCLLFPLSHSPL
jgi:hypothetical protein